MEKEMEHRIIKISDNIISPLGFGSMENYCAVRNGRSGVKSRNVYGLPEPFMASMFDRDAVDGLCGMKGIGDGMTFFERLMVLSAGEAISDAGIDPSAEDVVFIISSTKGNVSLLEDSRGFAEDRLAIHSSAALTAGYFGNSNTPIVISNACISGVCAQIAAIRALRSGRYRYAVVIGADVLCRFIVSGFQSFKALSANACRPFDISRDGLNLGEAAATIIYKACGPDSDGWEAADGVIRNDANHISGPSRTGEGCYRALSYLLEQSSPDELAFINVHGTSTLYNDEMESIAIDRAGLSDVPVNALKGYFGHTLGTAGILESIISMYAADDGIILGTKGYSENGVSCPVNISSACRKTGKKSFIKLLSGFGGCNASLLFRKGGSL